MRLRCITHHKVFTIGIYGSWVYQYFYINLLFWDIGIVWGEPKHWWTNKEI